MLLDFALEAELWLLPPFTSTVHHEHMHASNGHRLSGCGTADTAHYAP